MTENESTDASGTLDGLSVDRAVDAVGDSEATPDELRETLAIVAQDGVVSREAVADAIGNASMVVTTAETRVELAAQKLDSARETATSVSDLAFVSARVDNFEARLTHIETQADDLGNAIQEVVAMTETGNLYEIARRIKQVTNAATEIQRTADDFQFEIDSFEEWLTDADRRVAELTSDVDAVADSVNELDEAIETIRVGDDGRRTEPATRWAEAMIRHRVVSLMITDLRAELAAVRTWAERENATPPSDIEPRLDDIQASHTAIGERLTALAEPDWTARFDDQLTALSSALEAMEPPVVWADVEAVVTEHRPVIE